MYIVNKTSHSIVLAGVLAGQDLKIDPNSRSQEFVPNKRLLEKFLLNQNELELHVTRGSEINAATELDSRVETLLILD
jgi:hypothetical protein